MPRMVVNFFLLSPKEQSEAIINVGTTRIHNYDHEIAIHVYKV